MATRINKGSTVASAASPPPALELTVLGEATIIDSQIETAVEIPHQNLKLLSAAFSFFVAGTNDGSMGALLPYIISSYHIGTSFIAILYVCTFLGWLVAALTNSHLPRYLDTGLLLALGAALQLFSQVLRPWNPPFALFAVSYFTVGLGQAYQDATGNAFVASVGGAAHRWLGFIHAMYGFGCLVSPFVATSVASSGEGRWMLSYIFPLGLSVVNLVGVGVAYGDSCRLIKRDGEGEGRNKNAMREIKAMMKMRNMWLISVFFFFHLGVCLTAGGWVVEYLVQARHGNVKEVGYIPSGYFGGMSLGRLLLAEPTHRYGEFRMLLLYTLLCFTMQLVFWLVPNLISSAVAFSFMGFFLGPFFAAGVSVASRLLPKHVQSAALGFIFVTAQAGGAIFPSLIGIIASHAGVKVLQPIVAGLIVIMGITWAMVPKTPSHIE